MAGRSPPSATVRFHFNKQLVETHERKPPGGRSTKASHFPPEKLAYAQRDAGFLVRQAEAQGKHVGLEAAQAARQFEETCPEDPRRADVAKLRASLRPIQ